MTDSAEDPSRDTKRENSLRRANSRSVDAARIDRAVCRALMRRKRRSTLQFDSLPARLGWRRRDLRSHCKKTPRPAQPLRVDLGARSVQTGSKSACSSSVEPPSANGRSASPCDPYCCRVRRRSFRTHERRGRYRRRTDARSRPRRRRCPANSPGPSERLLRPFRRIAAGRLVWFAWLVGGNQRAAPADALSRSSAGARHVRCAPRARSARSVLTRRRMRRCRPASSTRTSLPPIRPPSRRRRPLAICFEKIRVAWCLLQ